MTQRNTRYIPTTPAPEWDAPPPPLPTETKAIHLRLEAESAYFLALTRVESGATAETIIEALLQKLKAATPQERQEIYQIARTLAQSRKEEGLKKRKRTYQL